MLSGRNVTGCDGGSFYTYDAFVKAAGRFPGFGGVGDGDTRRRELAAFFAQTSYLTGGYCYVTPANRTGISTRYYSRGPIQLATEDNYRRAGEALGLDLAGKPDLVSTDPVVAFETAVWFWMTPQQPPVPSCHAAMTGNWTPSAQDRDAGLRPGYGVTTYILSGGAECGGVASKAAQDRANYYRRYCGVLQVGYGDNLFCKNDVLAAQPPPPPSSSTWPPLPSPTPRTGNGVLIDVSTGSAAFLIVIGSLIWLPIRRRRRMLEIGLCYWQFRLGGVESGDCGVTRVE